MIRNFLLIGLGGALGSMLRFGTSLVIGPKNFPLATLLINIIGSFVIGLVIAYSSRNDTFAANWKLFFATGVCGGFTTFSAFSLENLQLLQDGKFGLLGLYIAASVLFGLAACWIGFRMFNVI